MMIHDFSRLFTIESVDDVYGFTGVSRRTSFVLRFRNEQLNMEKKSGRDPLENELFVAMHAFLRAYEEEYGTPVETYQRQSRYRIVYREGESGCLDYCVETESNGDGYPSRHWSMHVSMAGKVPSFGCFAPDLLDLMVGQGCLKVNEGHYAPQDVTARNDLEAIGIKSIKIFKPRLTGFEEGWVNGWDAPPAPVPLTVVCERLS